jgi:hypothetical protein
MHMVRKICEIINVPNWVIGTFCLESCGSSTSNCIKDRIIGTISGLHRSHGDDAI